MLETLANESAVVTYADQDVQKIHEKYGLPYEAQGKIQLAYALAHTGALGILVVQLDTGEVLYGHSYDHAYSPTEIAAINRRKRVLDALWLPK
jgi:hypothetical protein